MTNDLRHSFLESWQRYPQLEEKIWSPRELRKQLAKVVAGEKPKKQELSIGGRLRIQGEIGPHDKVPDGLSETYPIFVLESEGEEVGIALHIDSKGILVMNERRPDQILKTGDLVKIDSDWESVRLTGGMSPDLSYVVAKNIDLLAPCEADARVEEWDFKRGRQWDYFHQLIRKCFQFLEFTEVRSPNLVVNPGSEPHLSAFEVSLKNGSKEEKRFLPTSPELHLKKLLSEGWHRIFEIKDCFRNDEMSEIHSPEFRILEWYRGYSNLSHIKKDLQGLLNYLKLHWPDPIRGFSPLRTVSVAELFKQKVNFDLTPKTTIEDLTSLCEGLEIQFSSSDRFDDLFHRIFIEKLEPELKKMGAIILEKYPPSQAALARIDSDGWAERFEFYWKGFEIANAFHELNDPCEYEARFYSDMEARQKLGLPVYEIDQEYLDSLKRGCPPAGGIALGMDRLFMALTDLSHIDKARPFGTKLKA